MTLDWQAFTPWTALAGGLLIGLSAVLLVLGAGRIAGIAGLVGGALQAVLSPGTGLGPALKAQALRLAFLAGLLASPWLWRLAAPLPATEQVSGGLGLVLAGLLVGVGVRMGNGCTSGHGVCGLSRLSLRSLANVAAFMGAGFVTVFVLRHVL